MNLLISLRYHPLSSTLLALIGANAFAFNKHPHNSTFSESVIVTIIAYFF